VGVGRRPLSRAPFTKNANKSGLGQSRGRDTEPSQPRHTLTARGRHRRPVARTILRSKREQPRACAGRPFTLNHV